MSKEQKAIRKAFEKIEIDAIRARTIDPTDSFPSDDSVLVLLAYIDHLEEQVRSLANQRSWLAAQVEQYKALDDAHVDRYKVSEKMRGELEETLAATREDLDRLRSVIIDSEKFVYIKGES